MDSRKNFSKNNQINSVLGHVHSRSLSVVFLSLISAFSLAEVPDISEIAEQHVAQGQQLVVLPSLANTAGAGAVNWSKAFGHDDIKVNPLTGAVSWQVPDGLPSESFHLGLRASNLDGAAIETFIIHVGVDKVVYVGPNEPAKGFIEAFGFWAPPGDDYRDPGITFVVRDGTYTGDNGVVGLTGGGWVLHPPSGIPSKYTTIMAENPGEAVLSAGGRISLTAGFGDLQYMAFKGFHIESGNLGINGSNCGELSCEPHHIKFIRNGVSMKHNGGAIGITRANHVLFENNYGYGGTRVRFGTYRASNTIFRRNVGRFDFDEQNSGPKNTFSFYTSMNISGQNNIAIDADSPEFMDLSELAGEFGCPTTAGDSRIYYDRNIQLNSDLLLSNYDSQNGAHCLADVTDMISWDNRGANGSLVRTRSASLINHATFGDVNPPSSSAYVGFAGWPSNAVRGLTNTVLHNFSRGPLFYGYLKGPITVQDQQFERIGVDTINVSSFAGEVGGEFTEIAPGTVTNHDPIWTPDNPQGGLRYLVRIEANSNLSGQAKDGGDLGANVTTFIGKSGTLWGEPGWNTETNVPAWPYPYQEVIAEKMRSMVHVGPTWEGGWVFERTPGPTATLSGDRGFARAETNLTDYIWSYMGNTTPPMSVGAVGGEKSVVIRWDPPSARAKSSITAYKVYDYNPDTGAISNPRNAGLENTATVSGLNNGQVYHFAVTAVASDGETGFSYPVTATPSHSRRPMPPVIQPI